MREELKNVPVLAMYDVRGIQKFIFRTNKVREIIGASALVENIITNGLQHVSAQRKDAADVIKLDWEGEEDKEGLRFMQDETIQVQVLFIGGGNAYVLYRTGELCSQYNRLLARYILEETYSLQLAVAVVKKTDSYKADYDKIQKRMAEIKNEMPVSKPVGAFPIVRTEMETGYPVSEKSKMKDKTEWISRESWLKRQEKYMTKGEKEVDKLFDNMVTEKGKDSILAVVHIDGNNMGARIRELIGMEKDYSLAALRMRKISLNIRNSFLETFRSMEEKCNRGEEKKKLRKIVVAGDDITFICNGAIALNAVEYFLKDISAKVMYQEGENVTSEDLEKYGFTACAGIAYINSHFPFSDGYEVAEACCSSAKARAKKKEHRGPQGDENGIIGNWIDFQICKHIRTAQLEQDRVKNYQLPDGERLDHRPYYVDISENGAAGFANMNKTNGQYSFQRFVENIKFFNSEKIPRSFAKNLRNIYIVWVKRKWIAM